MPKFILLGACALTLVLTGCMPRQQGQQGQQGQNNSGQYAQNPQAFNQPVNPNQPAPYLQPGNDGGNGPSPWPGTNSGSNGQMPANTPVAQGPDSAPYNNGEVRSLQLTGAPQGMQALKSQAGYVFRARLSGSGPIQQQSRDFYMKLMPYFDNQPQVMGYLDEPSGRMSQVGFQATKNGAPVMGMMMVTQGADGSAIATVMLDSPERFQQSMQIMTAAAQQP